MKKFKACLLGCFISITAGATYADDMQKFYDDGYDLLTEFRKCSTISNQFSEATTNCLNKSGASIQLKTKQFETVHKADIARYNHPSNNLVDRTGFVAKQKEQCQKLYPEPLRNHFKNQIKSCQVQVDLNRFFYLSNTVLGY